MNLCELVRLVTRKIRCQGAVFSAPLFLEFTTRAGRKSWCPYPAVSFPLVSLVCYIQKETQGEMKVSQIHPDIKKAKAIRDVPASTLRERGPIRKGMKRGRDGERGDEKLLPNVRIARQMVNGREKDGRQSDNGEGGGGEPRRGQRHKEKKLK